MKALLLGAAVVASCAAALLVLVSRRAPARRPFALAAAALAGGLVLAFAALVLDEAEDSSFARTGLGVSAVAFALASLVGVRVLARTLREHRAFAIKLAALEDEQRRYVDHASSHLEASRARFRALTEASPLGIVEFDRAGACTYVSRRWAALTGCAREEAKGRGWLAAVQASERDELERDWLRACGRGERFEREFSLTRGERDAPRFGLLLVSPKPRESGGELRGFIGTLADVTARHRADDERRRLEERVRHAEQLQSLGVLAGGIAHDFNNLVIGILGNLEVLQGRLSAGEDGRAQIERVEQAAQRAAELASQLLAFAGRGSAASQAIDLSALVGETAPLVDHARPASVELALELDRELPAIEGDASQVRQVVMNLLLNSFAACSDRGDRAGPGRVEVRTAARSFGRDELAGNVLGAPLEPGSYALLEVADDGAGLAPADLERMFDPFFTTRRGGRGLGLAVVFGVVRRLRGSIQVESTPGAGTRVRVLFPRCARPTQALGCEEQRAAD